MRPSGRQGPPAWGREAWRGGTSRAGGRLTPRSYLDDLADSQSVTLRDEAGFRYVQLTTPAKQTLKLPRSDRGDVVFADTESVGIYRYQVGTDANDKTLDAEPAP